MEERTNAQESLSGFRIDFEYESAQESEQEFEQENVRETEQTEKLVADDAETLSDEFDDIEPVQPQKKAVPVADVPQLEAELKRVNYQSRFRALLRSTVYTLIVVAAMAVLVAVLFLPVLRIYGNSMTPTLNEGEIVVSIKGSSVKTGDVVGVYYGSKLLIKRCIASQGQWVDIDEDGNVYVDGEMLDEPYVDEKAFGECNIELPYQVPDNAIFVMGDHRDTSIDSRNSSVGCIDVDEIVGKIIFRVWPIRDMGVIR